MSGIGRRTLQSPIWDVTPTSDPDEPDMITYECSEQPRAKMSCGHVIGPESLYEYCSRELSRGSVEFVCPCPGCDVVWDYPAVRHAACLTDTERQEFERQLSLNTLNRANETQQCNRCRSLCSRVDPVHDRTRCLLCTTALGSAFDFCWNCLQEWNDGLDGTCGNANCPAGRARALEQLTTCPVTNIAGTSCPAIRACPECRTMIQHAMHCQHVKCRVCAHYFCFICLKKKDPANNGRQSPTTCASPWSCKIPAPRQTLN